MTQKMERFLLSIGIKDPSVFKLEFVDIKNDNGTIVMKISKEDPWAYFELSEFLLAISNIRYPFRFEFVYPFELNNQITKELFLDFYRSEYFLDFPKEILLEEKPTINIEGDNSLLISIDQFNEICSFVCYPSKLVVKNEVNEEKKEDPLEAKEEPIKPILEEKEATLIHDFKEKEENFKDVDISKKDEESSGEEKDLDGEKLIEEDRKKILNQGEVSLINQLQENLQKMKEEREKRRVWKIGDYKPVDNLASIYDMDVQNIDIDGEIFELEVRMTKTGKKMATFGLGNYLGAVNVRAIEGRRIEASILDGLKKGQRVRIRGAIEVDTNRNTRSVVAHFIDQLPSKVYREDPEEVKRVELHLHTKLSSLDGCAEIGDYVDFAAHIGMKAIALTDHGCIQAFPAAQSAVRKIVEKQNKEFKMIYGCEFYAFSTKNEVLLQNPTDIRIKNSSYIVFDTETTGLSPNYDRILEIGAVKITNGMIVDRFSSLINADFDLSIAKEALEINHIDVDELRRSPSVDYVLEEFLSFIGDNPLVAHNALFDLSMVNAELSRLGKPKLANSIIDTLALSRYLFPKSSKHNEGALLRNLGLEIYKKEEAHRALYDAEMLAQGFSTIVDMLTRDNPDLEIKDLNTLKLDRPRELTAEEKQNPELVKKYEEDFDTYVNYCKHFRETHLIALAKNQAGLSDLYRLVTEAHVTYLGKTPRIPFEMVDFYRKNLLIGSACFNGNVFDYAMTRTKEELRESIKFYDYIEIQPLENYSFLINMKRIPSQERLISLLKDIIEVAKEENKPIVATGDCHYLNPEDKILRDVIIETKAIGGGSHPLNPPNRGNFGQFPNPDQHFRTTREMLDSFESWLSKEDAYEYVVTNSNLIADQVEANIFPISNKTFPPRANVEGAEDKIRDLCYKNFAAKYEGNQNPEVIERINTIKKRLDEELDGIINNGYAVTYYIAQQLIKKANDEPEHYVVGSRGSVGSSFAATMADITEVNPLAPHYLCPHCHYLEWGEEQYKSGYDLPIKKCPECGTLMKSDGQNIPFATFLGFHADKVPDIDLNFEDESQKKAFDYTKELLGSSNVFRAGTIQTVKTKLAYGYVAKYLENRGKVIDNNNRTYVAYIASKLEGIKRTTGQHAGGVIVIPSDHSLYEFTAVQYPADESSSKWLTTHYDFHSIHDEILKFDILGHLDPMAMRYYRDLTHIPIEDIPMNDKRVISLFNSTKELNLKHNYLNLKNGAAGLPEFGTNLGLSLLEETKPTSFNDLLIIEGLSHGTNVWKGNAQDLIREGKSLADVIGCRDDIMTYLISCGIDNIVAFKIMEDVRHGKRVKDEYAAIMRSHHIPEYYIQSANKIEYLFPRGHAAAYATMAVRVAYFKLYHPLEFYAVFFSIRSDDWNINSLIQGEEGILKEYNELKARENDRKSPLSAKEENILATDQMALEMLDRGYKFSNINLYKSDAKMFVVDKENKALIPPFVVIGGLGAAAAQSIVDGRNDGKGEFISEEDILKRAPKLNSTNIAKLRELGVLDGLSENNQLSLF